MTWAIVVGALVLVGIGLATVLLLRRPVTPPDLTQPQGVVRAYVEALDAGRPEVAWDLLAPSARAGVTRERFIQRATASYGGSRQGSLTIDAARVQGTTALVELHRTYNSEGDFFGLFGPNSYTNRETVRLEWQNGAWRITVPPDPFLIEAPAVPPPPIVVTATPAPAGA